MRCDQCKHWIASDHEKKFLYGECTRAIPFWEATHWVGKNMDRELKPEFANRRFFAQDGSDYTATVYTTPDFFCADFDKAARPHTNPSG